MITGLSRVAVAYKNMNLTLIERDSEGIGQSRHIPCIVIYLTMLLLIVERVGIIKQFPEAFKQN
jgi:hypothetical protein